jgi:hypothetical protein
MGLQTQVNLYYSGAVAGDRASQNPVVYRQKIRWRRVLLQSVISCSRAPTRRIRSLHPALLWLAL